MECGQDCPTCEAEAHSESLAQGSLRPTPSKETWASPLTGRCRAGLTFHRRTLVSERQHNWALKKADPCSSAQEEHQASRACCHRASPPGSLVSLSTTLPVCLCVDPEQGLPLALPVLKVSPHTISPILPQRLQTSATDLYLLGSSLTL